MRTGTRDHSLGEGVYFAAADYVGMTPRIVILVVDLAVLIAAYALFAFVFRTIAGELNRMFILVYAIAAWAYMTVLKGSRIRTLGYRVTGSRIVNLRGQRPSILRMTFRLALWAFGPFSFWFDWMWSGIDRDRQTLRDRFSGTCVVKNLAEPIGTAEIHLIHYNAFGFVLAYPGVTRPSERKHPQTSRAR